jgi:GNAT superfamily N-acetyltransferase
MLDRIIARLHQQPQRRAMELVELSDLQSLLETDTDRDAFRRLAFPRARRAETIEVKTVGDRERSHVVVRSRVSDRQGANYTVSEPTGPIEVGETYRLFLRAGYPKTISEHDRFLVVSNDHEQIVAGVCYQLAGDGIVHLDGVAVQPALYGRGIASALLEDFCARMTDARQRVVKTHFFLRGFYLKRGFQIDRRWGGLVRFL